MLTLIIILSVVVIALVLLAAHRINKQKKWNSNTPHYFRATPEVNAWE